MANKYSSEHDIPSWHYPDSEEICPDNECEYCAEEFCPDCGGCNSDHCRAIRVGVTLCCCAVCTECGNDDGTVWSGAGERLCEMCMNTAVGGPSVWDLLADRIMVEIDNAQ